MDKDTKTLPPDEYRNVQNKGVEKIQNEMTTSSSNEEKPPLIFPFLKDCETDPLNAGHYFNLTLGGSMARRGDESHLKTLKHMFPAWFDPDYPNNQGLAEHRGIYNTHISPRSIAEEDMFYASSTNLIPIRHPRNLDDINSYSSISSPRTQTTSSSFHLSNLPTPRLSYHSISSNHPRRRSCGSSMDENSKSPQLERRGNATQRSGDSPQRISYDTYGLGIAFKEGVDLFPHYQGDQTENTFKTSTPENLSEMGNPDELHFDSYQWKNLPLGWSSEIMDTQPNNTLISNSNQKPNSKILWRKAASAGTFLRCVKGRSAVLNKSQSTGNLQTISVVPPREVKNQSVASNFRERRRSSILSQSGRRTSVVDRLLDGVIDIPEVSGISGLLQRRRRSSRKASEASVNLERNPKQIIRGHALQKFRRVVRVIQIITNVCWTLKSYVREKDSTDWSFYELYLNLRNDITPNLFFDRQQFCKIEPSKGWRRLECLLSIPPDLRTPDKIQQMIAFVRTHQTFQHFPVHVQVQFCQVMQYQSYQPRVVILKEGHPPSCFYMILSGSLMVNVRQSNPSTGQTFVQTVGMMHQGECFGDFNRIVRRPLFQQRDENIKCCINHQLFKEFPKEIFYTNPGHFFYQYFPKDSVISMNSNDCPFLILVKSGECQLLGSYKGCDPTDGKQATISRDMETLFPLYTDKIRAGTDKTQDMSMKTESVSAITSALESTLLKKRQVGKMVTKNKSGRDLDKDAQEFVQVATLKEGYVFGLEMLAGIDGPPLKVISRGVECILVSKHLFLTHANIKSLRVAGDLVTVFPPPSSLRQKVEVNRKWRLYKDQLVASVVS